MQWLAIAISSVTFAASYLAVRRFIAWSTRRSLLDIPNERSSHAAPVPRGGGIVIVALSLLAYLTASAYFDGLFSIGYLAGVLMIAGISLWDDVRSVAFGWRLAVQLIAASVLVIDLGWFGAGDVRTGSNIVMIGLTVGWLVWMVNAYNFMDGIDGIAGVQAIAACAGWIGLSIAVGIDGIAFYASAIAAATAGFLVHNWQPAKVFMGDVGSTFLGFTFAALPLIASSVKAESAGMFSVAAVLFLWLFLFDTVFTFLRRLAEGQAVWRPHREHLYQRLVISGLSHATVTMLYGLAAAVMAASTAIFATYGNASLIWTFAPAAVASAVILALAAIRSRKGSKAA